MALDCLLVWTWPCAEWSSEVVLGTGVSAPAGQLLHSVVRDPILFASVAFSLNRTWGEQCQQPGAVSLCPLACWEFYSCLQMLLVGMWVTGLLKWSPHPTD